MHSAIRFDPASVWAGLLLGAVWGFSLAGIAATLIRPVARPSKARPRPARFLLGGGIVVATIAAIWASNDTEVFAVAWGVAASTTGTVHLVALGLSRMRGSRGRSGVAHKVAWGCCGALASILIGLASDGGGLLWPAIFAVLLIDVAILGWRADRESGMESVIEGGLTARTPTPE